MPFQKAQSMYPKVPAWLLNKLCFGSAFVSHVLTSGLRFPPDVLARNTSVRLDVGGKGIDWALGAVVKLVTGNAGDTLEDDDAGELALEPDRVYKVQYLAIADHFEDADQEDEDLWDHYFNYFGGADQAADLDHEPDAAAEEEEQQRREAEEQREEEYYILGGAFEEDFVEDAEGRTFEEDDEDEDSHNFKHCPPLRGNMTPFPHHCYSPLNPPDFGSAPELEQTPSQQQQLDPQ